MLAEPLQALLKAPGIHRDHCIIRLTDSIFMAEIFRNPDFFLGNPIEGNILLMEIAMLEPVCFKNKIAVIQYRSFCKDSILISHSHSPFLFSYIIIHPFFPVNTKPAADIPLRA